jgi:hypothetical protein
MRDRPGENRRKSQAPCCLQPPHNSRPGAGASAGNLLAYQVTPATVSAAPAAL